MNYWIAEMTGMDVSGPLFDYFEKNWAPRGAETAQVLYNISRGWVTHNEVSFVCLPNETVTHFGNTQMNIFGHTGMKLDGNSAIWANYPESAVWMMVHVWDHFDFTNDVDWWKAQGWPLVKVCPRRGLGHISIQRHICTGCGKLSFGQAITGSSFQ